MSNDRFRIAHVVFVFCCMCCYYVALHVSAALSGSCPIFPTVFLSITADWRPGVDGLKSGLPVCLKLDI